MSHKRNFTKKQAEAAGLYATGLKASEIAEQLGVTTYQVNKWIKDEYFQEYFKRILENAAKQRYAKAISVLEKQMDDKNQWIAQGAARDLATRFEKQVTGIDSNKITVSLAGLPELGTPDNEEV